MCRRPSRLAGIVLAALTAAAVAAPSPGRAQVWVPLDGSPAGTPAEVTFDGANSDPSVTRGHVEIHGFWRSARLGPGRSSYDDLEAPGLPNLAQVGAPRLPSIRFEVGVLTGAAGAGLELNGVATSLLAGYHVWPAPEPVPFVPGAEPAFAQDAGIYGGSASWPEQAGAFDVGAVGAGGLPRAAGVSLAAFRWNPATLELEVLRSSDFALFHPGSPPVVRELPLPRYQFAKSLDFNQPVLAPFVLPDTHGYGGVFLFIRPPGYEAAIAPLVQQKKARGFAVTVLGTDEIGTGCVATRNAIASWYGSTPLLADHYCILVGTRDQIPTCTPAEVAGFPPFVDASDRPYLCPVDLTVSGKQVLLGRLVGSTPAEVAGEVQRTLA